MSQINRGTDIAAVLEHLAKKATPGPWRSGNPSFRCKMDHQHHGHGTCRYEFDGWMNSEYWDCQIHRDKEMADSTQQEMVAGTWNYEEGGIRRREDTELIVALVNNLPTILAALRQCATHSPLTQEKS